MSSQIKFYGIRHHGPGSARRLVEALQELQPSEVLVEGPADLSDMIPMLADGDMVPPVALLAYPAGEPERTVFWPFSVFSPEYQAIVWAVKHGVPARFIDLPVSWRFQESEPLTASPEQGSEVPSGEQNDAPKRADENGEEGCGVSLDGDRVNAVKVEQDPIGALALAAGYEDGESWWQDVIEENPEPGPIFEAVADAMRALRQHHAKQPDFELVREAHMRLEIAKSAKQNTGTIAVVCGAWHVPALLEKHTAKEDRERLKGYSKCKIAATWTPWTSPRLAIASGYAAGVTYPGWNRHVWESPRREQATRWVAKTARCLRAHGHIVSTASLIEAERLAVALAAIRERPQPGFQELTDATVACICNGNPTLWRSIANELLIGSEVGRIPAGVPLAPLLEDLQHQQKAARLKPEALQRELMVDLRSESGLFRSTLLHRLDALGVPWGKLDDPGRSRGTFRERWVLSWEPEFSVALVENLIYGSTIEQAAAGKIVATLATVTGLRDLSNLVFQALTAQLPEAAARVSEAFEKRAGQATDCLEMLSALPPIADALRYGRARHVDLDQLGILFDRIVVQASLALHHAARGLDEAAAGELRLAIREADRAIQLIESPSNEAWILALRDVVDDGQTTALVAGQSARLLYENDHLPSEEAVLMLARKLSPGTTTSDAAGFFEGFLDGAGDRLIHDGALRSCVNDWVLGIDESTFVESLPLFRRVFSNLDRMERQRLLAAVMGRESAQSTYRLIDDSAQRWPEQFQRILEILNGTPSDG